MYTVICAITGKEIDNRYVVRLEDNVDVSNNLYKEACTYYQKGAITSDEIKTMISTKTEFWLLLDQYVRQIQTIIDTSNISLKEEMKIVITVEEQIANDVYKASKNTLTIPQYLQLLKEVLIDTFSVAEVSQHLDQKQREFIKNQLSKHLH